jgi:hypothetical protein
MVDKRPLHIRVADALGWTGLTSATIGDDGEHWLGKPPATLPGAYSFVEAINRKERILTIGSGSVPRYDTDWSATGPIIERLRIELDSDLPWSAALFFDRRGDFHSGGGPTALLAVCNLLLSIHARGLGELAALLRAAP